MTEGSRVNAEAIMKKHIIIWLGIVPAVVLGIILLDPTCILLGLIRDESFYDGRPTTYWSRILAEKNRSGPRLEGIFSDACEKYLHDHRSAWTLRTTGQNPTGGR